VGEHEGAGGKVNSALPTSCIMYDLPDPILYSLVHLFCCSGQAEAQPSLLAAVAVSLV
jgi:hypothetical protein